MSEKKCILKFILTLIILKLIILKFILNLYNLNNLWIISFERLCLFDPNVPGFIKTIEVHDFERSKLRENEPISCLNIVQFYQHVIFLDNYMSLAIPILRDAA